MTTQMTQKQMLATVRDYAADLGYKATVRKALGGEYVARIVQNGLRSSTEIVVVGTFADACESLINRLMQVRHDQWREGRRRERAYQQELQQTLHNFAGTFSALGCTLMMQDHIVTMHSPRTGSHSLNMRLGVRPVSDLVAHACGFLEQQTHVR